MRDKSGSKHIWSRLVRLTVPVLALIMILGMPRFSEADVEPYYDGTNVYGNGCPLLITDTGVFWDENNNADPEGGELLADISGVVSVYAGGNGGNYGKGSITILPSFNLSTPAIYTGGAGGGTVDSTRLDIKGSDSGLIISTVGTAGVLKTVGNIGTVEGTFTIPSDMQLDISAGTTITIPLNCNLVNNGTLHILENGTIVNNGVLQNNGTFSCLGTLEGTGTVNGTNADQVNITMTQAPLYPSSMEDLEYHSLLVAQTPTLATNKVQAGVWTYSDNFSNTVYPGAVVGENGATKYYYTLTIRAMPAYSGSPKRAGYNFKPSLSDPNGNPQLIVSDDKSTLTVIYEVDVIPRSIKSTNIYLQPSSFTYNEATQIPQVVVKDGNVTLTETTDYTVELITDGMSVGLHTLRISGANNYTGYVDKTYNIVSTPLTLAATLKTSTKTYDGLADAEEMVNVIVSAGDNTINPNLYTYTAKFTDANAGMGKNVVVTVTLKEAAINYIFDNHTRTASTTVSGFTIDKAQWPAGAVSQTQYKVYQGIATDYSVSSMNTIFMPQFPVEQAPMTAGTLTFSYKDSGVSPGAITTGNLFKATPAIHSSVNSTLMLSIDEFQSEKGREVGYVELNVVSQNLVNKTVEVKLICKDRNETTCAVLPTIGELIFGQKLTDLAYPAGGRYESLNNNDVQGTYSWVGWRTLSDPVGTYVNSGVALPAQGSYIAAFKFTPNELQFAPYYGELPLMVKPKPVTHGDMKLTLNPTTYVYDGTAREPVVTAYDGQTLLTKGVDYVVTYDNNINAGTASVIVNGIGNYDDESTRILTFNISKVPISLAGANVSGKVYDGTVTAAASGARINGLVAGETLTQDVDYKLAANYSAADVNSYTDIPVTISLLSTEKANNYVVAASGATYKFTGTVDVTKATIAPLEGNTDVVNCFAAVYEYDLSQLLPALTGTKSYGEVTYEYVTYQDPKEILRAAPEMTADGTHLKLNVKLIPDEKEVPKAANATVRLTSRNFNFVNGSGTDTALININIVDRPVPQGTPTVNGSLMFGQELRTLTLSGTMTWNGVNVPGVFSWKNPHEVPALEGEYRAAWVFTPDSQAFHIAEGSIIINVITKQIDLRIVFDDVSQVYDGKPKTPKFTLRYNGAPLDLTNTNNEYFVTYEYSNNTYAGNGKLTANVTGIYTGTATAEFEIMQHELIIGGLVKAHDKKYDGTTVADVDEFYLEGVVTGDVLEWGRDYAVTAEFSDPNVGNDKTVSVNVQLADTGVATNYKMLHSTTTTTASIYQDNTHSSDLGWMFVQNNKAHTYEYDLADLLPAGRKLGSFEFEIYEVKDPTGIVFSSDNQPTIIRGTAKLRIPVKKIERTDELTNIASIRISINSQNYQPIKTSVYLSTTNRAVPEGEAAQTNTLTYGQVLNDLPIDGAMYAAGTKRQIPGRFVWNDSSIMPPVGEYRAGWTFTPLNSVDYAPVKGATLVQVEKAVPSGTPEYTPITEPNKRLRDTFLDGVFENLNNGTVVTGSVDWVVSEGPTKGNVLSPATIVEPDVVYTWQFMPDDTASYTTRMGVAVIYSTLPEPTPTVSPTDAPTPTATITPSPSASITPNPSPTASPNPTASVLPSISLVPTASVLPSSIPTAILSPLPSSRPSSDPTVAPVTAAGVNAAIDALPAADETKTTDQGGLAKNASMSATDYQQVLKNVINKVLIIENNYLDLSATDKSNVTEERLNKLQNVYYVANKLLDPSKLKLLDAKTGVTFSGDPVTGVPSLSVKTLAVSDTNYLEGKAKAPSKTAIAGYDVQLLSDGKAVKPASTTEISFIFRALKNKQLDVWHKNTSGDGEWESYSPNTNSDGRAAVTVKTLSPFVILTSSSNTGGGSRPPQTGDTSSAVGFIMIALAMLPIALKRRRA